MKQFGRVLIAALAMLALCAPIAHGDDDDEPRILSQSASAITQTSVALNARIDAEDDDGALYAFQYGPANTNSNYSKQTSWYGIGDETKDVSVQVSGLSAGKDYQFRAVAVNEEGWTYGSKVKFWTLKIPADPSGFTAAPEPAIGETVVAEVASGRVLVKEQGSSRFEPLDAAESVPVNSTFNTTQGSVVLETALPNGSSQDGTFWGGTFQVRQSASGKGMTEIALRGGSFASCDGRRGSRAVTYRGKNPVRKLWGKDQGGRFKTSAKGSVATVRGTEWLTIDRCDGTLTKVRDGAVKVRERGTGRSKLLRAGQSFLARFTR